MAVRGHAGISSGTIGYWFLTLFLIVSWGYSVSGALPLLLGSTLASLIERLFFYLYPILLLLALLLIGVRKDRFFRRSYLYLVLAGAYITWLTCYGAFRGNAVRVIFLDLIALLPVVGGFLLGRRDKVWAYITPLICVLTGVSCVLAIGFTNSEILWNRTIINQEAGSFFESVLTLAPLLAIVSATDRENRWFGRLFLVSAGAVLVYLYFGRRGIIVRAVLELVAAGVIAPVVCRLRRRVATNAVFLALFASALIAFFPFNTLRERYLGRYGFLQTNVVENLRWYEAKQLWEELSPLEVVGGRGMGGAFMVGRYVEGLGLDEIEGENTGKIGTHLGAALPLLKGGIGLWLLYFIPCLVLFRGLFHIRSLDRITLGVVIAAPIWFASQFIEGAIGYGVPWVGFGVGLLFSRADRIGVPGGSGEGVLRRETMN